MSKDLKKITFELRKETCPAKVVDTVRRQIRPRESTHGRLFYASVTTILLVAMTCFIALWQENVKARQQVLMVQRARTIQQTYDSIELIGYVFVDAGTHSGKTIFERTVLPLRDGLQEYKNKIINNEKL